MQEEEKPGEREDKERLRREREERERRIAGLSQTASEYGLRISEVADQARDFVSDKAWVMGDKIRDLQNADLAELAENAKDYARRKPGRALLISAGIGFLLGLIIRGRR
jgi:ElaB/YqjD/DUF883 family membrane-anchored ribosome-binding protein